MSVRWKQIFSKLGGGARLQIFKKLRGPSANLKKNWGARPPGPYGRYAYGHSVWSAMKLWAKIRSPASKGIICQNIQRVLKKIFITDFNLIIIKQKYL